MNTKNTGNLGEKLATAFLILKGYKILERNFLIKGGELDIIAEKNDELVVVEVKTRKNDKYGAPKEAIDRYKISHIAYATKVYINKMGFFDKKVRFDVIEIYLSNLKINHIKDAFEIF